MRILRLRLGEEYTAIDTTESSRNIGITPYDPLGDGSPYQRPRRPRSAQELSIYAIEFLEEMRRHIETSRTGTRRPSWLRRPDWRFNWEREHKRLIRPRFARGIDRFLLENRGQEVVNFRDLDRLLTRVNPDRTRVTMGARFGSHDIAAKTIGLHNEVLDLLEEVWNPDSPYYGSPTWTFAGGKLHDLPEGMGTASDIPSDPGTPQAENIPPPRSTGGSGVGLVRRTRGMLTRRGRMNPLERAYRQGSNLGLVDRFFGDRGLQQSALHLQTFDEAGGRVRPGSGVYLGDGLIATAAHTQIPQGGRLAATGTAQTMAGRELAIEGLVSMDTERDLSYLETCGRAGDTGRSTCSEAWT